jgi:hypothetical protein
MSSIAGVDVSEMTERQLDDARAHVLAIRSNFGGVRPKGGKPWSGKRNPNPGGQVYKTSEFFDAVEALGGGYSIK